MKNKKIEAKLTWWGYPIAIVTPDIIWPWFVDVVVKYGTLIKLDSSSWKKASLLGDQGLVLGNKAVETVRLQGKGKIKEIKKRNKK